MAAPKYLKAGTNGIPTEITAVVTATADSIVSTDSTGRIAQAQMPTGVGPESVDVPASVDLVAGDFVNFHDNVGATNVRKADATDATKQAHGFVLDAVVSPASATVYVDGQNDSVTGLTPAVEYFLSTTPGGVTTTAPAGSGNLVQSVGVATLAGSLVFKPVKNVIRA